MEPLLEVWIKSLIMLSIHAAVVVVDGEEGTAAVLLVLVLLLFGSSSEVVAGDVELGGNKGSPENPQTAGREDGCC